MLYKDANTSPALGTPTKETAAFADNAQWGYAGDTGPDHWGDLCPAYHMAKDGKRQSPIDIPSQAPLNPADLVFDYHPSTLHIVNNGNSIQANYDDGSCLHVDGAAYPLRQFHFHNPSETTVDGVATPMEIHLVHTNEAGEIAVVGGFIVEGAQSIAYAPIFDNMPTSVGETIDKPDVIFNAADLLPVDQRYWRYDGSLTTPPCTEGVKWFMLKSPIEISAGQIDAFKALYTGNARPVQPMNDRRFLVGQRANTFNQGEIACEPPLVARVVTMALLAVFIAAIAHLVYHRNDHVAEQ